MKNTDKGWGWRLSWQSAWLVSRRGWVLSPALYKTRCGYRTQGVKVDRGTKSRPSTATVKFQASPGYMRPKQNTDIN